MATQSGWRSIEWPDGQRISVNVMVALEDFIRVSQFGTETRPGKADRFSLSYGEYGARVGAWRLLELFEEEGITSSWAVNGLSAQRHPELVKVIADAGHELIAHGWANDVHVDEGGLLGEQEMIKKTIDAITEASGGVRPVGWCSPALMDTPQTKSFLVAEGCTYTVDDMSDDVPFVETVDGKPIATIPYNAMASHDLRQYLKVGSIATQIADSFEITFDQLYEEGGRGRPAGLILSLHAHVAGRPTLIPAVRRAIQYAKSHSDTWISRLDEQAEWAIKREYTRP